MVDDVDEEAPIFAIAVAAELAGMHPQTSASTTASASSCPRARRAGRGAALRHVKQLREVRHCRPRG
jgi:MerR family transcriptional regulator/heat shock protein HspR